MDLEGFEPSTSSVRLRRAPNCATGPIYSRENFIVRHSCCQVYLEAKLKGN